jgi:hypothetical protein
MVARLECLYLKALLKAPSTYRRCGPSSADARTPRMSTKQAKQAPEVEMEDEEYKEQLLDKITNTVHLANIQK